MKRMPIVATLFGLLVLGAPLRSSERDKEKSADDKAVDDLVKKWTVAHDKGDAKSIGDLYAADADFVGIDGTVIKGRAAIVAMYTQVFSQLRGNKARVTRTSRRRLGSNVVIDDGTWQVIGTLPEGAPSKGRYTTIFNKSEGVWHILCARTMVPATRTALKD